jgi:redox-sensitive bicupin YhaK (pirin superfamily)
MSDPAYHGFASTAIPVEINPGGEVRVIAGSFGRTSGPVRGIAGEPVYMDIRLGDEGSLEVAAPAGMTAFACVYEGELESPALPEGESGRERPYCALFGEGDRLRFKAGRGGCSLVFACGRPLGEEIAWRGPIVMNTEAELDLAFDEFRAGTFVKKRAT